MSLSFSGKRSLNELPGKTFSSCGRSAGIHLRTAREEDACQIAFVWQKSIREICGPAYPECPALIEQWASSKTVECVRESIENEEWFMVAETGEGEICGFFCCTFEIGSFALFVSPDCRRRGIGRRLFSCYERMARICGMSRLSFNSSRNAVSFYLNCGCTLNKGPLFEKYKSSFQENNGMCPNGEKTLMKLDGELESFPMLKML